VGSGVCIGDRPFSFARISAIFIRTRISAAP